MYYIVWRLVSFAVTAVDISGDVTVSSNAQHHAVKHNNSYMMGCSTAPLYNQLCSMNYTIRPPVFTCSIDGITRRLVEFTQGPGLVTTGLAAAKQQPSKEHLLLHLGFIVVAGIDLILAKHAAMQSLLSLDCSIRVLKCHIHKAHPCGHLQQTAQG